MLLNTLILSQGWKSLFLTCVLNPVACFRFFLDNPIAKVQNLSLVTWYFLHVNLLRCWGALEVSERLFICYSTWVSYLNLEVQLPEQNPKQPNKKHQQSNQKTSRLLSCLLAMVKANEDTKRCVGVGRGQLLFLTSNRGRRTCSITF